MDPNEPNNSPNEAPPPPVEDPIKFVYDYEDLGAGLGGKRLVARMLTTLFDNPDEMDTIIETFQEENGIILPLLRPMLPLLFLLGVKSFEFHQSVMEELREKLIQRIDQMAKDREIEKMNALLAKSFPLVHIPMLQPVVMALLRSMESIDSIYIRHLMLPPLYDACDVTIKRHIWQVHQSLLLEELKPIFHEYIVEKDTIFAQFREPGKNFFQRSPRMRRQTEVLQKLAKIVGKNVMIYDTTLQTLRSVWKYTGNTHYCTLRVSLVMELHETNVTEVTSMDECHKFVWCLDACIREQTVEQKRMKELQGIIDSAENNVLYDIAMALGDPYAANYFAQTIFRILNHQIISNESLPRDHNGLQFLLRLLNLSLNAHDIVVSARFEEPVLNSELLTRFLPIIVGFMVDDMVRSVTVKLPPDDRESALNIIEHGGPPPDIFTTYITNEPVAAVIALYYVANAARQRDKQAVMRVLGFLTYADRNVLYQDGYLHVLTAGLICLGEEFSDLDLVRQVVDELYMAAITYGNTFLHLLKLIYHVHQWILKEKLETLIMDLQRFVDNHIRMNEEAKQKPLHVKTFQEFKERLEKVQQEREERAAAAAEKAQQAQAQTPGPGSESIRGHMPMMTPAPQVYMTPAQGGMTPSYYPGSMSPFPGTPGPHSSFQYPGTPSTPSSSSDYHSSTY